MSDNPLPFFLYFSLNKIHLKRPEILFNILLSLCFVLSDVVGEDRAFYISGSWGLGRWWWAGGGEDVGSCTPLVLHTYSTYINTNKPPSPCVFFFGNSPESWLN